MPGCLPESALAVVRGGGPEAITKYAGHVGRAEVAQAAPSESPKLIEGGCKPCGIMFMLEDYCVQMGGHDDVGVDAQALVLLAVHKAVGHDAAGRFGDENREPINDRVGNVVDRCFVANAVGFHEGMIANSGLNCERGRPIGRETAATAGDHRRLLAVECRLHGRSHSLGKAMPQATR